MRKTLRFKNDDPTLTSKLKALRAISAFFSTTREERDTVVTYEPMTREQQAAIQRLADDVLRRRRAARPTAVRPITPDSRLHDLLDRARTAPPRPAEGQQVEERQRAIEGPVVDREDGEFGRKLEV